ncbi:E1 ubiquitin-activating protein uba2 [Pseudocyphellaria aurata]|nr:E1 ubiquitin-activating protein uba2 [Pseudocyphellaria aurata]
MGRDRYPRQSLGALYGRIKQSRILMVGAGGIGCELLKNLVLTGFGQVHIVDLDTIDLSNLNRQFLFRHEHIKKSKAVVAKESAAVFNPHIKLEAHHANIKDPQFNLEFFQSFNIVFNALDNLDARRHVNKMCLAADVPLIESGTTGFNGQVQVIKKVMLAGILQCWMVAYLDRELPSVTIATRKRRLRPFPSAPSGVLQVSRYTASFGPKATCLRTSLHPPSPIMLMIRSEIFGTSEDNTPELDHSDDSENAKEIENLRQESQALKRIRSSMSSDEFPRQVFDKVFKDDINRLRSIEDMWKTRAPPQALAFDKIAKDAQTIDVIVSQRDQTTWTLAESFVVFCDGLRRLSARLKEALSQSDSAILSFDKDDDDTLDFVAAAANLRSFIFGIETRSKFDIKQIAGNIIPAIATTNAMTASLCVLQAFKVMRDELGKAKMVFLERSAARVINTDTLKPPNPACSVCGVMQSKLVVDPARATLNHLVEDVLKTELGYGEEFSVNNEVGTLYDPELDDNLPKKIRDLGIEGDSFLTVIDDDEENPRVNLSLSVFEQTLPDDSKPVLIPHKINIVRKTKPLTTQPSKVTLTPTASLNGTGSKRKRSLEEIEAEQDRNKKRGKLQKNTSIDELALIDDSSSGAIIIEDD